jgi:hypothetical protein
VGTVTATHTLIDWAKVGEWLGKSWRWVTAIFCAAFLALTLPESTLSRLGVCDFIHKYYSAFVAVCCVTGVYLLTYLCGGVWRLISPHILDWRIARNGKEHLRHLSNDEKAHCQWFVDTDGDSLNHNLSNGALGSLVEKNILFTPGPQWGGGLCDFRMRPWALAFLKEHPELLKKHSAGNQ